MKKLLELVTSENFIIFAFSVILSLLIFWEG